MVVQRKFQSVVDYATSRSADLFVQSVQVWGCMWFLHFLAVLASIMENSAGIPFTNNWKLRVTKAPNIIQIDSQAPTIESRITESNDIFKILKTGFNRTSTVTMRVDEPYMTTSICFYVVISLHQVSASHAALRFDLSKQCLGFYFQYQFLCVCIYDVCNNE